MGLSPSGDYFNIRTQNLIKGLKGVHKSIDDMMVEAVTRKDLFNNLEKLLSACKDNGVTLHPNKFIVGSKVKFGGG